jgi:hypothetical protein
VVEETVSVTVQLALAEREPPDSENTPEPELKLAVPLVHVVDGDVPERLAGSVADTASHSMKTAGAALFHQAHSGQTNRPPMPVKAAWKPSMQVT